MKKFTAELVKLRVISVLSVRCKSASKDTSISTSERQKGRHGNGHTFWDSKESDQGNCIPVQAAHAVGHVAVGKIEGVVLVLAGRNRDSRLVATNCCRTERSTVVARISGDVILEFHTKIYQR